MPLVPRGTTRAAASLPILRLAFVCAVHALPQHLRDEYGPGALLNGLSEYSSEAENKGQLIIYLVSAGVLVLLGGAFAGLTIALMGQDEIYLQVIATSGEGAERKNAAKVLNLLKKGKHWVLVSLLLSNVITNETLPIMLDRSLGGGWQAVIGSTVLIVVFGEIVPQSICVRYGLPIGAVMAPFVLLLMWMLAPVAWPTAKLLDYLLGEDHGTTYKKAGLKTLVTLHRTLGTSADERLNKDEVTIISAVLDLKEKQIGSIMTPMDDVFTLSSDAVLDEDMINEILSEGYSRIPIHEVGDEDNFIGMLLVKMLIAYDPEDCLKVHDFQLATLPETRPETSCLDIINFFQEGKSHMILVSESPGEPQGVLGVVTLEDVIEELIGEEIVDESDVFVDVHKAIRRMHHVPYYRIPKSSVGDIKENGQEQDGGSLVRQASGAGMERKLSTISDAGGRSQTAKFMRRKNSGGTEPFNVSRRSDDIRAHLKHLGPSNLASKPKSTRINAVKIKPGQSGTSAVGTSPMTSKIAIPQSSGPEAQQASSFSGRIHTEEIQSVQKAREAQAQAEETTGLLSAGFTASDGAHAVNYGSVGSNPTPLSQLRSLSENVVRSSASLRSPLRDTHDKGPVKPTIDEAEESQSEQPKVTDSKSEQSNENTVTVTWPESQKENVSPNKPASSPGKGKAELQVNMSEAQTNESSATLPAKLVVDLDKSSSSSSEDEDNEDSSGNTVRSTPSAGGSRRSGARSGSIHERGIDLGGLRKVVLDVREQLDDVDEDAPEASGTHGAEDDNNASETTALLAQDEGDQATDKTKKKKKKKKPKKKKANGDGGSNLGDTGEASDGVRLSR